MQALGNYEDIKKYAFSHFLIESREFSVLMTHEFFFFSVGIKGTAPFCKRWSSVVCPCTKTKQEWTSL